MTDKKLNDKEIIYSLEVIATTGNCDECKIRNCKWGTCNCSQITANVALDLINRQKIEIESLKKCPKCFYEYDGEVIEYCVQGPCPNFKPVYVGADLAIKQIKAEAYKEFAKEVSEEIGKAYNNNSGVLREHFEKHKDNPNFEFVATIMWKMNTLRGLDDFIDNLLKEMVGEED